MGKKGYGFTTISVKKEFAEVLRAEAKSINMPLYKYLETIVEILNE